MKPLLVAASLLLMTLAGCANAPSEPIQSPDPIHGVPPATDTVIGRLHLDLEVAKSADTVPAKLVIDLAIATTNAVGEPLPGNVSWRIDVTGPKDASWSGTGTTGDHALDVSAHGIYTITASATAPRFESASISKSMAIGPVPLAGDFVLQDGTRGQWFSLEASAQDGYSQDGFSCAWVASAGVQVLQPDACRSEARWLADGDQNVSVVIFDGHSNVTITRSATIAPLTPLTAPTAPPADPLIVDDPTEKQAPHLNLTHAWMQSDLDHLYVALAVNGIPHAQSTRDVAYSVTFTPSWNVSLAQGQATELRVVATNPLNGPDGTPTTTAQRSFELQAKVDTTWQAIGDVPGAAVSVENGIFWWPVPRSMLQAPLLDATVASVGATVDGASDDTATTVAEYVLA